MQPFQIIVWHFWDYNPKKKPIIGITILKINIIFGITAFDFLQLADFFFRNIPIIIFMRKIKQNYE